MFPSWGMALLLLSAPPPGPLTLSLGISPSRNLPPLGPAGWALGSRAPPPAHLTKTPRLAAPCGTRPGPPWKGCGSFPSNPGAGQNQAWGGSSARIWRLNGLKSEYKSKNKVFNQSQLSSTLLTVCFSKYPTIHRFILLLFWVVLSAWSPFLANSSAW